MSQTFIISSHNALKAGHHHDLYLEDGANFMSFALPKGMSTIKGVKHLAIRVDSHSPESVMFEGEIKEGYGKGTKVIWDEGTYVPYSHITASQKPIRIDFFGSKIVGPYYLKYYKNKSWLIWRG